VQWNGAAVRALRKKSHLTQAKVAEACGVTQGHIASVEAGRHHLNDRTARLVARALELDDLRALMGPDDLPDEVDVP
jgi:transcriptional regulator with XRE-family HTH domain